MNISLTFRAVGWESTAYDVEVHAEERSLVAVVEAPLSVVHNWGHPGSSLGSFI
jgi:hypothetical protein